MAGRKRKIKKKTIRFELTLWGLFGLGVVCCCIFLWMFLLGLWAGQTILQEDAATVDRSAALNHLADAPSQAFSSLAVKRFKGA